MKRFKKTYTAPVFLSLSVALLLAWLLLPPDQYGAGLLLVLLPMVILAIGFHFVTHQRIQTFRGQLQQIIQTLEEFDVDEPSKVTFEKSSFPVFNELNEYLHELITRIRTDYQASKQFTQNASHELQTPLAIIKGHVELLLQSPNLGEKEVAAIGSILQNTNRLSKINSALILLSKIEHQRFTDTEEVDLNKVTDEVLFNFTDLLHIQRLEVRKNYAATFKHEMSAMLAEILIANLVQNAVRHNSGGYIEIKIRDRVFKISNQGEALKSAPGHLFKRFKRQSDKEESLGLGLSIVKQICEQSYGNRKKPCGGYFKPQLQLWGTGISLPYSRFNGLRK